MVTPNNEGASHFEVTVITKILFTLIYETGDIISKKTKFFHRNSDPGIHKNTESISPGNSFFSKDN